MVPVFRSVMTTSSFCAWKARSPERRRASSSVRDGRLRTLGRDANAGDETRGASIGAKPFVTKCFHSGRDESTAAGGRKMCRGGTAPAFLQVRIRTRSSRSARLVSASASRRSGSAELSSGLRLLCCRRQLVHHPGPYLGCRHHRDDDCKQGYPEGHVFEEPPPLARHALCPNRVDGLGPHLLEGAKLSRAAGDDPAG